MKTDNPWRLLYDTIPRHPYLVLRAATRLIKNKHQSYYSRECHVFLSSIAFALHKADVNGDQHRSNADFYEALKRAAAILKRCKLPSFEETEDKWKRLDAKRLAKRQAEEDV